MSEAHDRIAQLVSRYAAGDVESSERAEVEAHLESCAECRALIDTASLIGDARKAGPDSMFAHPEARLLSRFALRRSTMPAEAHSFVAEHLDSCEACADAVRLARESAALDRDVPERRPAIEHAPRADRAPSAPPPLSRGLWDLLKGTLLRPELAFAYLALIAVLTPIALRSFERPPASRPTEIATMSDAATVLPSEAVSLSPSEVLRGERAEAGSVRDVPVRAGQATVLLALETDLDPVDWEVYDGPFELSVEADFDAGAATILRQSLRPTDVDETGTVRLAIPARLLKADVLHRATITAQDADEPPLFEVRFRPSRR